MRFNQAVWGFVVLVLLTVSLVSACGGAAPEPAQPAQESEPTETSEPVEPTVGPTEEPTEAPTEEPTAVATEEKMAIDAEALVQERCTECHALNRTTNARKSSEEWDQTVSRMVGYGAELNDEEQAALVDYLAENYGP